MNIMKRIRNLCIAIIALVGLSSSAFAQTNSGTTPAIGTPHKYWVNANVDGSIQEEGKGNSYTWYLTSTIDGTAIDIGAPGFNEFAFAEDYNTATVDLFAVNITWQAASAGSTYYLHIIETDKDNGCTNHKAEIITPFSDFQLAIANVTAADLVTAAADDLKVCAPNVALSLDGDGKVEYNYGTTALYYKVDATNIDAADYVLGYNIDVNDNFTETVKATYSTDGGVTYSDLINYSDGDDATQPITNTANASTVIIKVELVNGTAFEGITAHDVTVKLVSGTQEAASAKLPADVDKKQNVPARPSTSGIGSN
ncbi:hypothetical protein DF185_20580 [Marinifilum breve]|uniref:F5/8 type C domain-containing protein n=2 Tax=Marinifilum breve TaxID=2184082 RepID=A0A2V4A5V2_9BACT|nr:hypothetical protein DF185_20580 [Marinifilum breve]